MRAAQEELGDMEMRVAELEGEVEEAQAAVARAQGAHDAAVANGESLQATVDALQSGQTEQGMCLTQTTVLNVQKVGPIRDKVVEFLGFCQHI